MLKEQPCQGLELPLGKDIWTDSRGFTPMPLGLRIMQLGLELINLTIPSYLTKILIGHTLYMVLPVVRNSGYTSFCNRLIGKCDPCRLRGFCTRVGLAISELQSRYEYKNKFPKYFSHHTSQEKLN